jgi:hypothetical protein
MISNKVLKVLRIILSELLSFGQRGIRILKMTEQLSLVSLSGGGRGGEGRIGVRRSVTSVRIVVRHLERGKVGR